MGKKGERQLNKRNDLEFKYSVQIDPALEQWRTLAAEWFEGQRRDRGGRRYALDKFLLHYLHRLQLEKNPYSFMLRSYSPPSFWDSLSFSSRVAVACNNVISDFLDWALQEKFSVEDDYGHKVVPAECRNPVSKRSHTGTTRAETYLTPLPYRYIRELRGILCQGSHFSDWTWAQGAIQSINGGDWFEVNPALIAKDDPDCVWRKRTVSVYRKTAKSRKRIGQKEIHEIWSPVRAVVLYMKLTLPLRTHQVRMLDSGEADTWRYDKGKWKMNSGPLATGSEKRPSARGVFHRTVDMRSGSLMTGFYINTNKTADINKDEKDKGYVIPWQYDELLYWLDKMRNWQEKYNPLNEPAAWTELKGKHDITLPHKDILKARGTVCFLFRHAAARKPKDRTMPLIYHGLDAIWYFLLAELQRRCERRGETLEDGSIIEFVVANTVHATHYPLHSLRVSLITAYALDGGVPFHILSKLIAGHARLIMTLYYTKAGKAHVTEVMSNAERAMMEKDKESYRRFLANATYQQIEEQFAFNDPAALVAATQQKSTAGFVFEDKGICIMGCAGCNIGGDEILKKQGYAGAFYAPVPGYLLEKNCVRCRFFITGPAFLPGLISHFNYVSYQLSECSNRYVNFEQQVSEIEGQRHECGKIDQPFTRSAELEQISRFHEQEAQKADKLANDLHATLRLINRCTQILKMTKGHGVKLVAVGTVSDVGYALQEMQSEMHQIEVICENAVLYPEGDASTATLRRSQVLDAMLELNSRSPVFFKLTREQQLLVGNHLMQLIRQRVGTLKNAISVAEGKVMLDQIGLLDEAIDLIEKESGRPVLLGSIISGSGQPDIPEIGSN